MVTRAVEASNLSIANFDQMQYDEPTSIYQKEWEFLFSSKYYLEKLKSSAMKGKLKSTHFRSICWKIFLKCLPENRQLWIETAKSQRQHYEEVMDKFDTNPRNVDSLDITVNNPLSQSQQSPWNQYFQDTELKVTIEQDVVRTFPEIEFFHTPNIQKMMINILFSYAREFPHVSYKQGMHELLGPILFVLHYDQQAYLQASETDSLDLEIHILLNQNYTEHDAFFLFCQLMESVEAWYTMTDYSNSKYGKLIAAEPFSQSTEVPGNLLGRKLKRIYEQLLKHYDIELFLYFEQMEITPQIFGIRWLRLLFGREFSIHDLLIVWDAIFADSCTFHLVDHIFVAMLISIRDLLLQGDYASCLSHLMRFPNVVDVHYIVDMALHLRDPDSMKKPDLVKILNPLQLKTFKDIRHTVNKGFSKNSHPSSSKTAKVHSISNKSSETRPKSLSIASVNMLRNSNVEPSPVGARAKSSSLSERNVPSSDPDELNNSSEFLNTAVPYSKNIGASFTLPRTRIRNVMENRNHKFHAAEITQTIGSYNDKTSASDTTYREMVPLVPSSSSGQPLIDMEYVYKKDSKASHKVTEEIKMLKAQVSELKLMNAYCTQEITQHLEKLQESMMRQSLLYEDEMFIALAGIKRARDILKGTVNFSEVLGDDMNPYSVISPIQSKVSSDVKSQREYNLDILSTDNSNCNRTPVEDVITEKKAECNIKSIDCAVSSSVIKALSSPKFNQEQGDGLSDSFKRSLSFKSHSDS